MHSLTKEQFKIESQNKPQGWKSEILSSSIINSEILYLSKDVYESINLKYLKPPPPSLPSNWEMFKNLVVAAKDAVASGLKVRGPEDTEKALKICAECPKLVNDGGWLRCGACGCGIGFSTPDGDIRPSKLGKLAIKAWHCPLNKW